MLGSTLTPSFLNSCPMNVLRFFSKKNALDFAKKQKKQLINQRGRWILEMSKDSSQIKSSLTRIEVLKAQILDEYENIEKELGDKKHHFKQLLSIEEQIREQDATIKKLSS